MQNNENEGVILTTLPIKEKEELNKKSRVWEIDFLRGFSIILMVFDHMMWSIYDFVYKFFDVNVTYYSTGFSPNLPNENGISLPSYLYSYMQFGASYYNWDVRIAFRHIVLIIFFVICGIAFTFSKNNIKRGLILLGCGVLITALTGVGVALDLFSLKTTFIPFGVLSCFGAIILVVYFAKWLTLKLSKNNIKTWYAVSFTISLISIFLTIFYQVSGTDFDFASDDPLGIFIGIIGSIFGFSKWGGDFFPLFPYLAYFLIGEFIGLTVYKNKESLFKRELKVTKPISFIGKHTIWVYLAHIPLITLFHAILYWSAGFNLNI